MPSLCRTTLAAPTTTTTTTMTTTTERLKRGDIILERKERGHSRSGGAICTGTSGGRVDTNALTAKLKASVGAASETAEDLAVTLALSVDALADGRLDTGVQLGATLGGEGYTVLSRHHSSSRGGGSSTGEQEEEHEEETQGSFHFEFCVCVLFCLCGGRRGANGGRPEESLCNGSS
ncbi:hypothetical protein QOT17_009516 [Balamuthia mandrillaris]